MTTRKPKRLTVETTTSVVLRTLIECDDFRTCKQLSLLTGRTFNQCSAALHHLRNVHAVDCVEQPGNLWWFATPQNDTRLKPLAEVAADIKRPRKPGAKRQHGAKRQSSK